MKPECSVQNECHFMCVKFYLNRCRFPLVIAKCLGGVTFCGHSVYHFITRYIISSLAFQLYIFPVCSAKF